MKTLRNPIFQLLLAFLAVLQMGSAQERLIFKQADTVSLHMDVFRPARMEAGKRLPALVFFFGGGWNKNNFDQFIPHARYFARRGLVCFVVAYRVKNSHNTTPFQALEDAKSAMRYVRSHASEFGVDPNRIAAAGGSAGGHLAAACALVSGYDAPADDTSVNPRPDALILYNPVIDNGPGGYGYDRIGPAYPEFSPLHRIAEGAPPTVFFLGTEDHLVPVATARYYQTVMEAVGSRCDLHLYKGQGHGFFNHRNFKYYKKTLAATDAFLQSLGYLGSEPAVPVE